MSGEDGAITLDIVVETVGAAGSVDDLINRVNNLVGSLRRVRDGFSSIEIAAKAATNAFKDSTAATLKAMRSAPTPTSNGASAANLVQSFTKGLGAAAEQATPRAAQAGRRLVESIEKSIQAALNQVSVASQIRNLRYGTPEAANARLRAALIQEQRKAFGLGNAQSYSDILRREAAISLDRQRQRAFAKQLADQQRQHARLNDPILRIQDARRLRRADQIGDKGLDEVEAMDARRLGGRRLQDSTVGLLASGIAIGGAAEAIGEITELDDKITLFKAVTGSSEETTAAFKDRLLEMGAASRYSINDIAGLSVELGKMGLSVDAIDQTLPNVINLAASAGVSLHEAGETVSSILGSFNLDSSQTANISNTLSAALTHSRLSMEALSGALLYSADSASQSGVSLDELTAVLAGLAQAGIRSGSVLGTSMRQLLRAIQDPTPRMRAEMEKLGITLADIDIKSNGFLGVLDNLRAKGFTTAEAFKGLQARTVGAYAALQVQSETIKRLHEEFLLYDGATDGAATANTSLAARTTELNNALIAFTTKTLAPTTEALKALTGELSNLFAAASQHGTLLAALGTTLTGVATGLAAFKALEVTRNFVMATSAMVGLGTAAGESGAAVAGLAAAFGPIGVAVGIAAAAAAGFLYFSNSADRAADRVNRVKKNIEDLDASIQQTSTTGQDIDKMIGDLLAKRDKLNVDPLGRRRAIIEAQKAFASFGVSVKASASNVNDLIDALRRLRGQLSQTLPGLTSQRLIQTDRLIDEQRRQIPSQERQRTNSLARIFLGSDKGNYSWDGARTWYSPDQVSVAIAQQLGPDGAFVANMIQNWNKIPQTDVRSVTAKGFDKIRSHLESLRSERASTLDSGKQVDLDQQINKWMGLSAQLNETQSYLSNIQSNLVAQDRLQRQQHVEDIQQSSAFLKLKSNIEELGASYHSQVNAIAGQNAKPEAEQASLAAARTKANQQLAALRQQLQAETTKLKGQGESPSVIAEALGGLSEQLTDLNTVASDAEESARGLLRKFKVPALKERQRSIEATIRALESRVHTTNDPAALDAVGTAINNNLDQLEHVETELAKVTADPNDPNGDDALKGKIGDLKKDITARRDEAAISLVEGYKRITESVFKVQSDWFEQQQKELDDKIRAMKQELKDPRTTIDRVTELRKAIDSAIDQAAELVKQSNLAEYQRSLKTESNNTYISTSPAGSVPRAIGDAVNNANRSDLLPFVLRLAERESGFNADAVNGSHRGLFQIAGAPEGEDIPSQVNRVLPLIQENQAALTKALGRTPSWSELYLAHQQGAAGAIDLLRNPNGRAIDALLGAYKGNRALASQAIAGNDPGADVNTLSSAALVKHVEDYFGDLNRSLYLSSADVLKSNLDYKNKGVDEDTAQKKRENNSDASEVAFRNYKQDAQTQQRLADEETRRNAAISEERYVPLASVRRLADESANLSIGGIDRAVTVYDHDPSNDKDGAGRQTMISEQTSKAVAEIAELAKTIAGAGQAQDKKTLARLETLAKVQTEHPERFSQAETRKTVADLYRARQAATYNDPINALQNAIDFVKQFSDKLGKLKNVDPKAASELGMTLTNLETQLDDLKGLKKQSVQAEGVGDTGTVSNAIAGGTTNFFESKGLYNPNQRNADGTFGAWTTQTQQIGEQWQQVLSAMDQSTSKFFMNWATGAEHGSKLFKSFAQSILQSMAQIASNAVTNEIFKLLFGSQTGSQTSPSLWGGILGVFAPHALGGYILPRFASGGSVSGGSGTRDDVPALLQGGEFVLRKSAVDMIGRDNLDAINNMGNARISQSAPARMEAKTQQVRPLLIYNVVPQAVPPPDKDTIIHYIAENMVSGGQTRQLVRQIAGGTL